MNRAPDPPLVMLIDAVRNLESTIASFLDSVIDGEVVH
jgi:hypothetical protein